MKTIATLANLRDELDAAKLAGHSVGLVPTMGALHEGHLSLIDRSVAENGVTVVTIFVNPTQFRAGEDLDRYPRRIDDDTALAAERGADILFTPDVAEIYPDGFSTNIAISGITETLCGDPSRRGREHFDGVATVVAKLFNMVEPNRAYFGQKDAQQVAVIRRLVRDLNFRVEVVTCPTVREPDGLAMSSRNAYLSPDDRGRALALNTALTVARDALAGGRRDAASLNTLAHEQLAGVDVEYFELVDPDTLVPVTTVERPVLAAVAAHVGATRLIDNMILDPYPAQTAGNDATQTPGELATSAGSSPQSNKSQGAAA